MYVAVVPLKRLPGSFQYFTYRWGEALGHVRPGLLVMVPWRTRTIIGVVWQVETPISASIKKERIKDVASVVSEYPLLDEASMRAIEKISAIYKVSLSAAAALFLPPLQKSKLKKIVLPRDAALQQMRLPGPARATLWWYNSTLLGEQYRQRARQNIARRTQTVIVFPYRYAARQWIAGCNARLKKHIVFYDTSLSPKERFEAWMRIKKDMSVVVVGEHLAVCAPTESTATIIIADEHASAHKQWDMSPRYHNRDVAFIRAKNTSMDVVLASPTPSVETLYGVHTGHMELKKNINAAEETRAPHTLIDLKNEFIKKNFTLVSDYAWEKTAAALREGGSALYLLNRRGWGRIVGCRDCGFTFCCRVCGVPEVYHEEGKELRCHHCRITAPLPLRCLACNGVNIYIAGAGTEKIHAALRARMEESGIAAPLVLIDKDHANEVDYSTIRAPFVAVATNAILPYLSLFRLNVICVVNADRELARPEFGIQEKLFEEWWNAGAQCGELIIQTTAPESVFLNRLSLRQFDAWYKDELAMRKRFTYPPFCAIVKCIVTYATQAAARRASENIAAQLRQVFHDRRDCIILDPAPSRLPAPRGAYRFMITVKVPWETRYEDAARIASHVPDSCKIDFNPL